MENLQGKNAIITGAGKGIGRAIAIALATEGVNVGLIARTESDLQKVADEVQATGVKAAIATAGVGLSLLPLLSKAIPEYDGQPGADDAVDAGMIIPVSLTVNGKKQTLQVDTRTSLLDALREDLQLTGTKKGCDRGQCGACTVLVNGRRINSCLHLAAMCQGAQVTTIEGFAKGDTLHPMQQAFIEHDAFQCGYCTPGQICSAVGLLKEGHAKTDAEIKEAMSGNICRCGAYPNILEAIKDVMS